MSKKVFTVLLLVTALAAGLVLLLPDRKDSEPAVADARLLPDLAAMVGDLNSVRIESAGGEVVATLVMNDGQWQVQEEQSYPADTDRLKTLLNDLSMARILERKTSNPDLYSRLGVEDVAAEDATGTLVAFDEATGLSGVIVGNTATGRDGRYVRLDGTETSLLVDRRLDVPAERQQWLDRDVIDVSRDEIVEVSITHPDGEVVRTTKISADDENFTLSDIPEGREPGSDWSVNSLAGGLASLRLESVKEDTSIDWSGATVYSALTADGMRANGWLVEEEDGLWIRLGVSVYQAMGDEIAEMDETQRELARALTDRVNEINERVSGWAYRIQQNAFETMTKRQQDLLKPVDSTGT